MELRNVRYPGAMNASGAFGFHLEGYRHHRILKHFGLTRKKCAFTAKTTGMQQRLEPDKKLGNMYMQPDGITPRDWFPNCIIVKPFSGVMLNAVGLAGPGAARLLAMGKWQEISEESWNLSFMSVLPTTSDRLTELREFVQLLLPTIHSWNSPVGLEMNFSCPNAGLDPTHLIQEVGEALSIANTLEIPLQCKFNACAPVRAVCEVARHPACDAIVMGNTIPWGSFPDRINWKRLFGSDKSPLSHLGGGGLSGPPLRAIHCDWIRCAIDCGMTKPIWGCGGIDTLVAVEQYYYAGASGIQYGTACITRPWNTWGINAYAYELFS